MQWGTPQLWLEGDLGLNGASATDKLGDLELLLSPAETLCPCL